MAVVLPTEDDDYFAPSLRRSYSQTKFSANTASYSSSTPTLDNSSVTPTKTYSTSPDSSAPSSPQTSQAETASDFSFPSTPATNFSIASDYDETLGIDEAPEDHFSLPPFSEEKFYIQPHVRQDDNLEPPPSPRTGDSYNVTPDQDCSYENSDRPSTPECGEHAEDDTAVTTRPSRQVDYLSHEWKEEDIWSSWRYVTNRRNEFANSARLENASWRTWMKAKNHLKTVSPETLNWLKDCDVTWLYGPLQSGSTNMFATQTEPSSQSLSKTNSLVNFERKKPILKKRSMSEVMLQRSISTASLLKQATAAVHAQETRGIMRPQPGRAHTSEFVTFPFSTRGASRESNSSVSSSMDSSGLTTPNMERKHIHFNEQVEQCIAVDLKGDEEDTDRFFDNEEDSDSDEGVMMKKLISKKRSQMRSKRQKRRAQPDGKIIAKLPSTKLKYRADTPEPPETAMKHSTGATRSPVISPSSSQETLRPSKASPRFYIADDDNGDLGNDILPSSSGWRSPPLEGSLNRTASTGSLLDEPAGMRRTPSGMFMPFEEGESSTSDGVFGRVIDTVNTARDIAHVIWNVGWRK